jgi:hypothetical protein
MTEDTSPENLRKFLESDDPAMVRMGLSMAKGSGVPDNILGEILWMYMMHDDATIRAAAKSTFMKIAPEDAKLAVKKNWKAKYRTLKGETFTEAIGPLIQASNSQNEVSKIIWRLTEPIVNAVKNKPRTKKGAKQKTRAAKALGNFGERAVEPLIESLYHEEPWWARMHYEWTISQIDRTVPYEDLGWRLASTKALGNIGDKRALLPLTTLLGQLGAGPRHSSSYNYSVRAGKAYHQLLIKATKASITNCIKKTDIDVKEKKNILKFLKSKDTAMVMMGASMLKGILEE